MSFCALPVFCFPGSRDSILDHCLILEGLVIGQKRHLYYHENGSDSERSINRLCSSASFCPCEMGNLGSTLLCMLCPAFTALQLQGQRLMSQADMYSRKTNEIAKYYSSHRDESPLVHGACAFPMHFRQLHGYMLERRL